MAEIRNTYQALTMLKLMTLTDIDNLEMTELPVPLANKIKQVYKNVKSRKRNK